MASGLLGWYDNGMTNTEPTTPAPIPHIIMVCVCCGRTLPVVDVFRRTDGTWMCGNCDAGEQPGCPNCGRPYFGGALDG